MAREEKYQLPNPKWNPGPMTMPTENGTLPKVGITKPRQIIAEIAAIAPYAKQTLHRTRARMSSAPILVAMLGSDTNIAISRSANMTFISQPNVDMNRAKDGAAPAPQETCLTKAPVPVIG